MALQVDEGNLPARNLYEQLGYRPYHPRFFRSEQGSAVQASFTDDLILERQSRYKARQLYDHYLRVEQQVGDGWAVPVIGEYAIDPPGGGTYWRCLLQGKEIGCAWCTGTSDWPLIRIALKPEYWGEAITGGLVTLLVAEASDEPSGVDVYLGSSAHHEKAVPVLTGIGYEPYLQSRLLMLKSLKNEQEAKDTEGSNSVGCTERDDGGP